MNCRNNSVSSAIMPVITRPSAQSCSIRAFSRSEFSRAFRNFVSCSTLAGVSSVINLRTRSASRHAIPPNCRLNSSRIAGKGFADEAFEAPLGVVGSHWGERIANGLITWMPP